MEPRITQEDDETVWVAFPKVVVAKLGPLFGALLEAAGRIRPPMDG